MMMDLIKVGLALIIAASPFEIAVWFWLSSMGVPDATDIGEMTIAAMPLNAQGSSAAMKTLATARFIQNIPLFIMIFGVLILLVGIFVPNENHYTGAF